MVLRLLAENLPLDPGIPPWITAAFVAAWLGMIVLAVAIWSRRRAYRRARRADRARTTSARPAGPPEDRQLGPGKDLEVW